MNNCCCTDKVFTSNIYYDGAYLPITGITTEDNGNTILTKIENVLATTSAMSIVPGSGISVSRIGSTYQITNTAPNQNQALSISGNALTLSLGGGTVTLPVGTAQVNSDWLAVSGAAMILNKPAMPSPQTLTWNAGTSTLAISLGNSVVLPITAYTAGTGISVVGNIITNTAPNAVQVLSISGSTISLTGGGGSVNIPSLDGSETKVVSGSNTSVTGTGTIASPYIINSVNTVYAPAISLSGNDLTIFGGNTITLPIPATPDGSETKVTAGANIAVTGTGTVASPYVVASTITPQTLSISGSNLSISAGNTIVLPTPDGSETKVTGGANTNVTGLGTTASPYIVNSSELDSNAYGYRRAITGNGLDTKGGFATGDTQYITASSVAIADSTYFAVLNNTAGAMTVTLPNPVSYPNRIILFKIADRNYTISFSGYTPVNVGTAVTSISQMQKVGVKSSYNGTTWVWETMENHV